MRYENVSEKTLKLPSKSVKPGDTIEQNDQNKSDLETFEERGYLEKVDDEEDSSSNSSGTSDAESTSGASAGDVSDDDSQAKEDIREPSEDFVNNLQKLEGIGGAKAQKIGRDWDSWSTFRDNVDREYLESQGLRGDQIDSNLEKLEE